MPIPISPYHFYERNGYRVRESHKGEIIKIEVETSTLPKEGQDSFVLVFEGLGSQQAAEALQAFILPRRVSFGA